MAIAPFLGINSRNGTPQVKRFINMSPTFIGVAIPTAIIDTDSATIADNRGYPGVVKFGGSRTFLATIGLDIWRTTDGGATWASVKTFTSTHLASTVSVAKSGLWVLHNAGVATAVVITHRHAGTAEYYVHSSTNGTSWTTTGPFTAATANCYRPMSYCVWRGKLVVAWSNNGVVTVSSIYDPVTGTMAFAQTTVGTTIGLGLTVFNDRLFMSQADQAAAGTWYLFESVAGAWSLLQSASAFGNPTKPHTHALFTDGTNMYGIFLAATAWKCFKWDSALARTDITSLVIPTSLGSVATTQRFSAIIDSRSVPGTAPTIWLIQSVDGGSATSLNMWKWNSATTFIGTIPGSALSGPDDTGGQATDGIPFVHHAQGTTFWTSGEDYVEMKGMSPAAGGITVSFTLYSDAGTGTGSVRAWHGSNTAAYPLSAATLSGTTTGLAKDNTTVHIVTWQAATDGYTSGQRAKFVTEKF